MIHFYFKLLRKLTSHWQNFKLAHLVASYKAMSQGRYRFESPFVAGDDFRIQSDLSDTQIQIGAGFRARDRFHIVMGQGGDLKIGANCFFNSGCSINCLGSIVIGDNCQFGEHVFFYDHNHRYRQAGLLISEQGYSIGSIQIGNNCWVGSNVVILKDVVIGDNVVIGAGCIIHQSIASDTVVFNRQDLKFINKSSV